jgi:hypothetical protein
MIIDNLKAELQEKEKGDKDRRLRATSTLNLLKGQYKELTGKWYNPKQAGAKYE